MPDELSAEFLQLQEALAGRYSLERELGRGGMGVVLLARDVALDRLVAIKLLPPHLAADPEFRERFLAEARTAAGLSHPNIVPIHVVEEHGDLVFFVMGYIDGETLRERVERAGPLSPRAAMRLIQEVAWALGYAHQRGVIHRDVKPENIMIERATERALVTDFGIAHVTKYQGTPREGEVVGTARYMSPEQACGEPVDARSDLYCLGATAFFALTGRAPFQASSVPALLSKHVSEPAPSVVSVRAGLPEKLGAIVDRCLRKDPAQRFASGDELAKAVGEARGRELRAPPLIRSFVRNAEVNTAVVLTILVFAPSQSGDVSSLHFIALALTVQLGVAARRLLRSGYTFNDIRAALLSEAKAQEEEAEAVKSRKWVRRVSGLWHRLWAGKFGRAFFKVSGIGVPAPARRALPSTDATELVLGRAATEVFEDLPSHLRGQLQDVPHVVSQLEHDAEVLRKRGDTGRRLADTVAALENIRLGLLRLRVGAGSVQDLTEHLERARSIGERIDAELEGRREVDRLLER